MDQPLEASPTSKSKIPVAAPTPDAVDLEYRRVFASLDLDGDGSISPDVLFAKLREAGILDDDPRIQEAHDVLSSFKGTAGPRGAFGYDQFRALARQNSSLIKNAIQGNIAIPDFQGFTQELRGIFETALANRGGKVADYIPQLGRVNPEQFALSVCTVDGQRFSIGDARANFCLQSVSKPINYCLALEEHGEKVVHSHIGREPSGRGFNELTLNNERLPHNPMINAGAIMSSSLVKPGLDLADRFDYVISTWERLTGKSYVGFNNPVYLSERQTADRNFAIGYFMRENKAFPRGTDLLETLEFYFQCCSIELNSSALAIAAGSLANAGICPMTGDKIFQSSTVQNCLSLMSSCGMYDFSGEFAFTIGLPAKSGVSGALMVVVPGVLGICIWSPRLDALGNSTRGIEFCKQLVSKFNFHNFDSVTSNQHTKRDPRMKKNQTRSEGLMNLCWASSQGDLSEMQRLAASGVDLDGADYDGRTALHLAASEGQAHILEYLISKGVKLNPVDRWGGTPISDAVRGKHQAAIEILEKHGARPS
jgi:glutaminase